MTEVPAACLLPSEAVGWVFATSSALRLRAFGRIACAFSVAWGASTDEAIGDEASGLRCVLNRHEHDDVRPDEAHVRCAAQGCMLARDHTRLRNSSRPKCFIQCALQVTSSLSPGQVLGSFTWCATCTHVRPTAQGRCGQIKSD